MLSYLEKYKIKVRLEAWLLTIIFNFQPYMFLHIVYIILTFVYIITSQTFWSTAYFRKKLETNALEKILHLNYLHKYAGKINNNGLG